MVTSRDHLGMGRHVSGHATDVLIMLPALAGGGAERVSLNLADGFVERGLRVVIGVRHLVGEFIDAVPTGVELVDLAARRAPATVVALARYLRRHHPRTVLSVLPETNVLAVIAGRLAGYRGRIVATEHNQVFADGHDTPYRRAFINAMRLTYPRAHRVIAVSHGVKNSLIRTARIPAHHIDVIYNPVITPHMLDATRHTPDHPYFHDGTDTPIILGVGRLSRQKNFANLIHAFAHVRHQRPARLLILGEGEDRHDLTQLRDDLDLTHDVALPGFVNNPYAYLAHAHLFALSSDWEGLPTVLIEALAAGTPVVSTNCPSGPDEILDNGRLGHLVPTNDPIALANAILTTLDQPRPPPDPAWFDQFTIPTATNQYAHALGIAPTETTSCSSQRHSRPAT